MVQPANIFHNQGLVLDRVTKRYPTIVAVDQVSLEVEEREFVAIMGPTGCIATNLFPRKPDQLSVGQKQVVGIGRALTIIPKILLLDEPFAHVDPQHRLTLRRKLKEYHNKMGSIALYVSHNLPEAFSLADRLAIMQDGKIIQIDHPSAIQSNPANEFVEDFIKCFEL